MCLDIEKIHPRLYCRAHVRLSLVKINSSIFEWLGLFASPSAGEDPRCNIHDGNKLRRLSL